MESISVLSIGLSALALIVAVGFMLNTMLTAEREKSAALEQAAKS